MVKCVSIFSGAGGFDIGALRAGANLLVCVDNDHDATETPRLNQEYLTSEIIEDDIQNVNFKKWRSLKDDMILIGGPPCQPFSKNGYWVKNSNRLVQSDPRNLLGQYIRTVSELKPSGFLFENVESILHPTNKPAFEKFVTSIKAIKYSCNVFLTNAADFGVPQKRKRVFVFGIRGEKTPIPPPASTHHDPSKKSVDKKLFPYEGVGRFIKDYASENYAEAQEDASRGTYYHELLHVPKGKNYIALSHLTNYKGKTFKSGSRFWNFLHKLHPKLPSITIAAQPGPWVGPFHWKNRRLRIPEIAAIQTFPKNYAFYGNRRSVQKQIGNAVPCLLSEKMVSHLIQHLP